jgi:SAM-dependent methyltransferase
MGVNPLIRVCGVDISPPMVRICREKGFDACVGDALHTPFRSAHFDAAISIAVLHHLSTEKRRVQALRELVRIVKPGGQIFVSAWAQEQGEDSRWRFDYQDVWVPWATPLGALDRYCHVYCEGELEALVTDVDGVTLDRVWQTKGNWNLLLSVQEDPGLST